MVFFLLVLTGQVLPLWLVVGRMEMLIGPAIAVFKNENVLNPAIHQVDAVLKMMNEYILPCGSCGLGKTCDRRAAQAQHAQSCSRKNHVVIAVY